MNIGFTGKWGKWGKVGNSPLLVLNPLLSRLSGHKTEWERFPGGKGRKKETKEKTK